jgi:transposase InsO family protein
VPQKQLSHVHVDLVGPPPQPREWFSHIMMMIDGSTRWVEAVPLSSTTTQACSVAFLGEWVTRFGVPALLTSDRGPQFTGTVCDKLGVQHWLTTVYHPQSNGMVEHVHRQIRDTLRSRECRQHWTTPCTGCFWGSRQRQRKIQQCLGRAGLRETLSAARPVPKHGGCPRAEGRCSHCR